MIALSVDVYIGQTTLRLGAKSIYAWTIVADKVIYKFGVLLGHLRFK